MKLFVSLLLLSTLSVVGQQTSKDSLSKLSYKELINLFYENLDNKKLVLSKNIGFYILNKAKKEKSIINQIDGHLLLQEFEPFETKIKHLDSVIFLSNSIKDSIYKKSLGYFLKGNLYEKKHNFPLAIKNYDLSILTLNNVENIISVLSKQGKSYINFERKKEIKEIKEIKENLSFYKKNKKFYENHIMLNLSISDMHRELNQIDSAKIYVDKAFILAKNNDNNYLSNYCHYYKGLYLLEKKLIKESLENLNLSYKTLMRSKDFGNMVMINFKLGKIYYLLKNNKLKEYYYKKSDSLIEVEKIYSDQVRKSYLYRLKINRKLNNIKKELFCINKIIYLDSMYLSDFKALTLYEKNNYKFKLNQNKKEKKKLENKIQKTRENNLQIFNYLVLLITGLAAYITFIIFKRKKDKQIFNELLKKENTKKIKETIPINIPKDVIDKILKNLENFEKSEAFLKQNINSFELAKEMETNKKYLSIIIKQKKQKSIPNYINELRVAYTINKLKEDSTFRKYTINTIAEEVGFRNSVSFTQAFKKHTKLNPSFFIKNILKTKDSKNL